MFTGIVEDMGTVVVWRQEPNVWDGQPGWVLGVLPDHPALFDDRDAVSYVGASICVSGVCLTVTQYAPEDHVLMFGE